MRALLLAGLLLLISSPLQADDEAGLWPLLGPATLSVPVADAGALRLLGGAFYFHYLNDDYQAALNQLARLRPRVPATAQHTLDVLETTLLLALGLEPQAQALFAQVLKQGGQVPAQAWLFLARRWYAQGFWEEADAAARQADRRALSPPDAQELLSLRISSLAELDQLADAVPLLAGLEGRSLWAGLAWHNILVAKIRNFATLIDVNNTVFAALSALPSGEEGAALADRLQLLAALYLLDSGRTADALRRLQAVRLEGPYSAPALLQLGRGLLQQGRFDEALQPLRVLQQSTADWHPAVLESLLLVPQAIEQLGVPAQALRGYDKVERQLQQQLDTLTGLNKTAAVQHWLHHWVQQQQGGWGWRRQVRTDDYSTPMSHALSGLLPHSAFQQQLAQYYDLHRMQQDLRLQQQQLQLWQTTLVQRQQRFRNADGTRRLAALQQQQQQAEQRMAQLEQRRQQEDKALFAYATPAEQQHITRLEQVVAQVRQLQQLNTPTRNLSLYKERWRRNRGILLWQMSEQQPQRRWHSDQAFWQLQAALDDAQQQLEHTRLAMTWMSQGWQPYQQPLQLLLQQNQQLQQQLAQLQQRQSAGLEQTIRAHLDAVQARLLRHQAQARLALARLSDDALQQALLTQTEEQP